MFKCGQSIKYIGNNCLYKDIDCCYIIKSKAIDAENKYIIENMTVGCIVVDEKDIKLV